MEHHEVMKAAEFAFIENEKIWHHLCGLSIADEFAAQVYEQRGNEWFRAFVDGAVVGYTSCHMEEVVA
jgi:hypothetical protein